MPREIPQSMRRTIAALEDYMRTKMTVFEPLRAPETLSDGHQVVALLEKARTFLEFSGHPLLQDEGARRAALSDLRTWYRLQEVEQHETSIR